MEIHEKRQGFTVQACTELPELSGRLWQMEHDKSGARLVWLDRAEENKTFAIAFRTLPEDHTGVFHILEHSVLSGSERYPVREPFVELMKSSMQTFLNALTYPDKTAYPVSSRDPKDFLNLVRVYMDAVLHPLIYSRPEIFRQEGWHFEMPKDDTERMYKGPVYKGVVFNEMKGAYADPDTRLAGEVLQRLFPDTSYRFESGGHPAHIPELTYEQFLAAHQRFYHPSNSYIFLDGEMDVDAVLAMLDGDYLSAYGRRGDQPQFVSQAPVKSGLSRTCYEISPDDTTQNVARLAWGLVVGSWEDREAVMAVSALADALCGSSEAPLKRRLLSEGLAQDVTIETVSSMFQPYAMLKVTNLDEDRVDEVERAIREELERLVREGLDHEQLAATLANLEFLARERDYGGMPQGLSIWSGVMASWLYGGDPAARLEVGPLFASLNEKLEQGWFEALLERVFLQNGHACRVLQIPSAGLGEEERAAEAARLRAAVQSWSAEDRAALEAQQAALNAFQAAVDTPEALASLPSLRLEDVAPRPAELPLVEGRLGGVPLLRHPIPTNGVGYVDLYFDVSDAREEELPYLALLCSVLGKLDTERHSSLELQKLSRLNIGSLQLSVEPYSEPDRPETCRTFLHVSFSALEDRLEQAAALMAELLTCAKLNDRQRLRELVRQEVVRMEQSVPKHVLAVTRVSAGSSAEGVVRELVSGISYSRWLKAREEKFDLQSGLDWLVGDLSALYAKVFTTGRLTASVTGMGDACAAALAGTLLPALPASPRQALPCAVRPWVPRKEGFIIPGDVSYAALGGSLIPFGAPYHGALHVAGRIVSLGYLWNAIRVQGGAYGTGLSLNDVGGACFWSFRDPGAVRSLGCYRGAAEALRQICADQPELTGLIVGAVAESDPLMLPRRKGQAANAWYFKGVSFDDRCRRREEMLHTTPRRLAALADAIDALGQSGSVCVIGSKKLVEDCWQGLDKDRISVL